MDQVILDKLVANFPGKIVRKDLTKKIKEGANVPVYVLEYLLGMYASSLDENLVIKGVENVKNILVRNYVRPDEAEKVKAKIRENGGYTVIDKVSVSLNERRDQYEAEFSNLGLSGVRIGDEYPKKYDRLLGGGIWCIVQMEYWYDETDQRNSPFIAKKLILFKCLVWILKKLGVVVLHLQRRNGLMLFFDRLEWSLHNLLNV